MKAISTLLFTLGLLLSLGFTPPLQSSSMVQLSVEVGFDGYYRDTAWAPVFVNVSNDGPDITGELRVRTPMRGVVFTTSIELPTQSRKQIVLYIALDSTEQGVQVELTHNNVAVTQVGSGVRLVQQPDVLYGVVTDSTSGSVNLDRVRPFIGDAYQANLGVEQLPAQAEALRALDALYLGDADTGRLTPAQRQALADWVLAGGHLIVGGGAAWQRTIAGLGDLLPVEIDGATTVEGLAPLEQYLGRLGFLSRASTIVTTGAVKAGAEVLLALPEADDGADIPLLVRGRYGQGVVDYLGADPTTEPLASWANTAGLWTTLLTSADQRPSWWGGFGIAENSWAAAQDAAEIIPFALPSSSVIAGFLIVYVLLIGPLNYLVLKRLKRRELAWITIPILIVLFGILAYVTGFGLRGTQAIVNRLSVVRVWPGADRAVVDGLIGLWSPFRTTYTLSVPEGYTLQPVPTGGALPGLNISRVEENATFTVRDIAVNIGSVQGFITQGFVNNPPALDGTATVKLQRFSDAATAEGEVTNLGNFALDDAVVLARGNSWPLGTLEPGVNKRFALELAGYNYGDPSGPPPAPLGLDYRYDLRGGYYYGYGHPRGGALTVQNILNAPNDLLFRPIASDRDRELRRRYMLLTALIDDLHVTTGRGNNIYIAAWARQAPIDVALTGAAYTTVDSTLYLFQLPATLEAPEEPVVISPHLMSWSLSDASTRRDLTPLSRSGYGYGGNFMLGIDERVGFRFTPLPGMAPRQVNRLILNLEQYSGATVPGVALWDWARGDWQVVPVEWGENIIAEPDRYVGPAGAVEVLVFNPTDSTPVSLVRVEVTLVGVL